MKDAKDFASDEYASEPIFKDYEEPFEWQGKRIGKEVGTAYHAFLEKFDFSKIKGAGTKESLLSLVTKTLSEWEKTGVLSSETLALLSVEQLVDILSLPVFDKINGATLYKEQQFFASLPVRFVPALVERLSEESSESVLDEELLFQGAIDLLAIFKDGRAWIIDYKFSIKNQEALKKEYAPQLALYKKAVARILKIDEDVISCSIVNLLRGFEIEL